MVGGGLVNHDASFFVYEQPVEQVHKMVDQELNKKEDFRNCA